MRAKAILVILALIGCLLPLGVQAQTGTGQGRPQPSGATGWLCMIYAPNPAGSGTGRGPPHYYSYTAGPKDPPPREGGPCVIAGVGRGDLVPNSGQPVTPIGGAATGTAYLCEIFTPIATGAGRGTPHYYSYPQGPSDPPLREGGPCTIANVGRGSLVRNTGQTVSAPGSAGTEWLCMIETAAASTGQGRGVARYYDYAPAANDPPPRGGEACSVVDLGKGSLVRNEGQPIAGGGAVAGAGAAGNSPFACRFTSGKLAGATLAPTGGLVLKGPAGQPCTDNYGSAGTEVAAPR